MIYFSVAVPKFKVKKKWRDANAGKRDMPRGRGGPVQTSPNSELTQLGKNPKRWGPSISPSFENFQNLL